LISSPLFKLSLAGGIVAALLVAVSCSVAPSTNVAGGEKIFRETCVNCHGAHGEGVDGKYKDALAGDWALPRLTRYIAKNMPDDDPGTLSPREAESVAAFIFDSFYSPTAQARLHPARIELSHLTNRQYLVTVADLLRQVGPPREAQSPELVEGPGLDATYYNVAQRGRFDSAKLAHHGTDATVDFVFPENGELRTRLELPPLDRPPTPNSTAPAGFSAQWRGSILADETGDHEFIIRTPNSVRVWINLEPDNRTTGETTLDINVSNPQSPDHRVTLRLIGGRRYPIAIDWWALAEKTGSTIVPAISLRWKPPHGTERPIPARNLSSAKTAPTFVVTTRFPADDSSHGYERGTATSKEWDDATTTAAFEVANHVAKRLDRLAGTRANDSARPEKISAFAARFVAAAFRRPLTPDETERHVTALLRAAPDPETGIRRVVLLALKSPQFLYPDLSAPVPDANHTAARLAFALWDSAPDTTLAHAAAENHLRTSADVRAQADRLLADPRAHAKAREFFHQWLQLRFVDDLRKDATLYSDFTPEVIDDLRASLDLFIDDVLWGERADFRDLLRSGDLIVNDRLAQFYGLPPPAGGDFTRVAAPPGQRSGVLTHPYLLAALSYKTTSSPIHRGVFLTRAIVGRALKPPPMAQSFEAATFEPGMTTREKVVRLTRNENCQSCHAVINPLGFSLEWYDAVGRYRTAENGRPIDAASDYVVDEDTTVHLASARDVADFALTNERAQRAFIEQLFQYLVKQSPAAYGPDTLARLRDNFVASGFNLRTLMADIATRAALHGTPPAIAAASTSPRSP
jgi:hypothetical protein